MSGANGVSEYGPVDASRDINYLSSRLTQVEHSVEQVTRAEAAIRPLLDKLGNVSKELRYLKEEQRFIKGAIESLDNAKEFRRVVKRMETISKTLDGFQDRLVEIEAWIQEQSAKTTEPRKWRLW